MARVDVSTLFIQPPTPRLTGTDIIDKLRGLIKRGDNPHLVIYATEPTHPGGIIHEGVRLVSVSWTPNSEGEPESALVSLTMGGQRYHPLKWYRDPSQAKPDERVIQWLEVYV